MVVFVVKRYAVREAKKWRYPVRNAKIERYAVRKGGGGCHPHVFIVMLVDQSLTILNFEDAILCLLSNADQ